MRKILIINQYAGNKGDRAVLFALCKLLLSNNKDLEIKVSTSNPKLWNNYSYYKLNNIEFIPSAWDYYNNCGSFNKRYLELLTKFKKYTYTILRENYLSLNLPISKYFSNPLFYKAAKKSDLIISTGGHHFTTILARDLVSSLPFDLCVALGLNKKTILFSQSLGPFEFYNKRNEKFIQKLLNNCQTLFIREKHSVDYLKNLNVKADNQRLIPETVISLNQLFSSYTLPSNREKKVGISIYSTKKRTEKEKKEYLDSLIQFCNYLNELKYKVEFFPMELKGTEPDDRRMINEIVTNVNHKTVCTVHDKDLETKEHIIDVAKCRFFVGHKTHSVVFALTSGTPLVAIEYHPKTKDFMNQFGVGNFSVHDSLLTFDLLKEKFSELSSSCDEIGKSCFQKSEQLTIELKTVIESILK